jgi:hypothetical protein
MNAAEFHHQWPEQPPLFHVTRVSACVTLDPVPVAVV